MAKESFDKEIQFLRMLSLTSGAYNRKQYAERLGISVHTFDKTQRRLKEIMQTVADQRSGSEPNKEMADLVRFQYGESAEPMLLFLFRAKSMKETEVQRLSILLHTLQDQALTAMELLDACCADLPEELALPDEKTIRSDLKYLEEVGVIRKEPGGRPYRYLLQQDVLTGLTVEEQLELYDFVDIMANTQVPSVQGYILRDSLKKPLLQAIHRKKPPSHLYINTTIIHAFWTKHICTLCLVRFVSESMSSFCIIHPKNRPATARRIRIRASNGKQADDPTGSYRLKLSMTISMVAGMSLDIRDAEAL